MKKVNNLLFVFDLRYYSDNGNIYGQGQFEYENFWKKKYLPLCNKLTVIGRKQEDKLSQKLVKIDGDNVHFINTYNMATCNFKNISKNKDIIKPLIDKSDLIIIRLPSLQGILACNLLKLLNKKYIIEVVGSGFESYWYHDAIIGKVFAFPYEFLMKKSIKNAENVMYVTNCFLQKKYPNNNNKIGISDVSISLDEKILKKKVKSIYPKLQSIKIGLVGSLDLNYKGHNTAIRILNSLIHNYNKKVELHFLGSGNKDRWIDYAKKYNVSEFLFFDSPRKAGQEMNLWYDELDFLLLPSLTEAMPRVCLEAMSRGVIVISTNVGDLQYILDKKNVFNKNKSKDMARRINEFLNSPKLMEYDILRNYEKCKEFNCDLLKKNRDDFLNKIIES